MDKEGSRTAEEPFGRIVLLLAAGSSPFHHVHDSAGVLAPLFTQVTLLWSSGTALGGDVALVVWSCRRGTGDARDQHAVGLPGDVAFEAADNLSLALALRSAPSDVLARARISPHTSQTNHLQRTVGVPVATAVEAVAHYLSRGGFHRRHSAEAGEGSLVRRGLRFGRRAREARGVGG